MIRKVLAMVLICLPLLFIAEGAESAIVNFDDLATPNNASGALWGIIPSTYAGYTWTGLEVQENTSYKSVYGNSYNFPSTLNAAYNGGNGDKTVTITSSEHFNFTSGYFWKWTQNDSNSVYGWSASSLTINAYDGMLSKGSYTINLALSPVLATLNFTGIDKIEFVANDAGKYWLMDNASMAPVPLPSSLFFLFPGLLGFVGLRKRIK
jgi:hypothetical protein